MCEKKITRCVLAFKPSLGLTLPLEGKLSTSVHVCVGGVHASGVGTQGGFSDNLQELYSFCVENLDERTVAQLYSSSCLGSQFLCTNEVISLLHLQAVHILRKA